MHSWTQVATKAALIEPPPRAHRGLSHHGGWGRLVSVGQQGTFCVQKERALPKAFPLWGACFQSLPCDPEVAMDAGFRVFHSVSFQYSFNPAMGSATKAFSQDLRKGKLPGAKKHFKLIWSYTDTKLIVFLYLFLYRKFSQNTVAQLWYFVKCVYFGLSAYQIRCGYPTRVLGNFLTKSYNYVNLFLFQG